jgi:hypothetical protein
MAYARNAIISGMMPSEIQKKYPNLWRTTRTTRANLHEAEFMEPLQKNNQKVKHKYHRTNLQAGKDLLQDE